MEASRGYLRNLEAQSVSLIGQPSSLHSNLLVRTLSSCILRESNYAVIDFPSWSEYTTQYRVVLRSAV